MDPRAVIDRIITDSAAPLLKAAGYRKKARNFHKPSDGLYRVASFQASQWNSSESASFTLNVCLAVPGFHEALRGRPFPTKPSGSAADVLGQRIGYLIADRDLWWSLDSEEDAAAVGIAVSDAVQRYALPYLERFEDLESLRTALVRGEGSPKDKVVNRKCLAWLHARDGRADEARRVLRALAEVSRNPAFGENVETFAVRIGVPRANA